MTEQLTSYDADITQRLSSLEHISHIPPRPRAHKISDPHHSIWDLSFLSGIPHGSFSIIQAFLTVTCLDLEPEVSLGEKL